MTSVVSVVVVEEWLALISKDALDELAESEESRLLAPAVPLLLGPLPAWWPDVKFAA